jgi:CubicO group peptidase (beta-lactamase class C family)
MIHANLDLQDITNPIFRSICEQIISKMEEYCVPGVAVGILHDGVEYTAGLGVTHIEHSLPITSRTLFEIGSTTKTMTALAVMRLVDQGKLDLDTPLRTYLPELSFADLQATQKATMRHLLTHTGGWLGDHFQDFGFGDDALAKYTATLSGISQLSPLGEVFSYCNSGFMLAGRLIEVVTGKVYEHAIRELVLDPLGLKNSFFFMQEVMHRLFATGHRNEDGTGKLSVADFWPVPRFAAPAGGLISDVHDQLRYARFLMGDGKSEDGTRLLKAGTLELMRSPMAKAGGGLGEAVGLSLMLKHIAGEQVIFHGGSINGQQSDFQFVPSKKFAFTLLTNSDNGVFLNLNMAPIILETFLGLKAAEPVYLEASAEKLVEYTGVYKKPGGGSYTISADEKGQLIVNSLPPVDPESTEKPTPEVSITKLVADDRVMIVNPPAAGMLCDFVRGANNEITWFRESGRIAQRVNS